MTAVLEKVKSTMLEDREARESRKGSWKFISPRERKALHSYKLVWISNDIDRVGTLKVVFGSKNQNHKKCCIPIPCRLLRNVWTRA